METHVRKPVHIGDVLQKARVFNFRHWRSVPRSEIQHPLLQSVEQFFVLFETSKVQYMLVGDIALLQYVEGRNTEDIDLIVAVADFQRLPEITITHQDDDFARGDFHGLRIDFLLTRNRLFDKVRRDYAATQPFLERSLSCGTVEGLLLLKMYALPALYRMGNFAGVGLYENDIATLPQAYRPDLPSLLSELEPHLSDEDFMAVREVTGDIERRIARFEQGGD